MKIYVDSDSGDYVEAKSDGLDAVKLSIRAKTSQNSSTIITASLGSEELDKLISNLILLKSKIKDG